MINRILSVGLLTSCILHIAGYTHYQAALPGKITEHWILWPMQQLTTLRIAERVAVSDKNWQKKLELTERAIRVSAQPVFLINQIALLQLKQQDTSWYELRLKRLHRIEIQYQTEQEN